MARPNRSIHLGIVALLVLLLLAVFVGSARAQESVYLEGHGQTATEPFYLPATDSVLTFTHSGTRNFIVRAYVGDRATGLVNVIGAYRGSRPLSTNGPVTLDIRADGPWSVQIDPIPAGGSVAFSGTGDSVSGWFDSPGRTTMELTHDGTRNFIVRAECAGGDTSVQNEIGPVSGSRVVTFRSGPCYWNVRADGAWSLTPR